MTIPSLINIPFQRSGKMFYPKPVDHCGLGMPGEKKWNASHCMTGNPFHVKINILLSKYEREKKKRFPDSKFHCLCAVVMCKGRALCGRDIVLYGKDIISRSRRAWNKVQSLPSLVPRLGLSETHCKQRCLVEDCCQ